MGTIAGMMDPASPDWIALADRRSTPCLTTHDACLRENSSPTPEDEVRAMLGRNTRLAPGSRLGGVDDAARKVGPMFEDTRSAV